MSEPIDRIAQLQYLEDLRDDLNKNIAEMQRDISDSDYHFARVVGLCSHFKEATWTFLQLGLGVNYEYEAAIRLFDDSPKMKEDLEQVDSEILAVSVYTASADPFDVWRHVADDPYDHNQGDDSIVGGFSVHGSIEDLQKLCQEAGLSHIEFDDSEIVEGIRKHEEAIIELRLRHEREKGEYVKFTAGFPK